MIEVITSFNDYYYNLIGKDSVESWLKYWPKNMSLTCYVEDFELPFTHPQIKPISFTELDPDYFELQKEDFHQSIKRFAKKAYSFIHAMHHSKADWIVWLDADIITQQDIPRLMLSDIFNDQFLSVYLGVVYTSDKAGNTGDWLVPETGFFGVNQNHKFYNDFRQAYTNRYRDRDRRGLRRFYDNDVFGAAIRSLPMAKINDLCQGFAKPYKTPLRHTVMGPYLFHYKAKHSKAEYSNYINGDSNISEFDPVVLPSGSD